MREGACGRRTVATPKPRPQAYLTPPPRAALPCPVRIPALPDCNQSLPPFRKEAQKNVIRALDKHRSIDMRDIATRSALRMLTYGDDLLIPRI